MARADLFLNVGSSWNLMDPQRNFTQIGTVVNLETLMMLPRKVVISPVVILYVSHRENRKNSPAASQRFLRSAISSNIHNIGFNFKLKQL